VVTWLDWRARHKEPKIAAPQPMKPLVPASIPALSKMRGA